MYTCSFYDMIFVAPDKLYFVKGNFFRVFLVRSSDFRRKWSGDRWKSVRPSHHCGLEQGVRPGEGSELWMIDGFIMCYSVIH